MRRFSILLSNIIISASLGFSAAAQVISTQPASVTVNTASTAEFSVVASGATNYQWQFGSTNIAGATNSTLTLEDLLAGQAGNYDVVINNSLVSSNAVLTIVPGTVVRVLFSNMLGGSNSYLDLALFDHDKPATVQNFLHYIRGGAYTNMFFHRWLPGFVLQGGGFGTSNRTDGGGLLTGWDIQSLFTLATNSTYPPEIDSEFSVGPLVHNRFGTIAMALASGSNTANGSFFFNLVDNSANLDYNTGGFTVFGQILDGTNLLQDFNVSGVVANNSASNIFLDQGTSYTNLLPNLPVNYDGVALPGNSNLIYCDFQVPTNAPVDTTPPTVSINTSTTNPVFVYGNAVTASGTSSDNIGVALVLTDLIPQPSGDGVYPLADEIQTNYAIGTTNWSISILPEFDYFFFEEADPIPPGNYVLTAQAQDGAGNISPATSEDVAVTGITITGNGSISFQGAPAGQNPIGYPLQYGTNYTVVATPATNQIFVSFNIGNYTTTNPVLTYPFQDTVLNATFISNNVGGIAFTSPTTNQVETYLFNITGIINTNILIPPVSITCQIFADTVSNYAVTVPQTTTGITNWTIGVTNYLATGNYFIKAIATDSVSNQTQITLPFSYILDTNVPLITITSPAPGAIFYETGPMIITGTASSTIPIASNECIFIPLPEPSGLQPNGSNSFGAVTVGTTNWFLNLATNYSFVPPGRYTLEAETINAAGFTNAVSQPLTISAILVKGGGTVTLTQGSTVLPNPIGYPLQYSTNYTLTAAPAAGNTFIGWTYGNYFSSNAAINFNYYDGLLTGTFITNNSPKGSHGFSFVYPPANAQLFTNSFILRGRIVPNVKSATITCLISSLTTGALVDSGLTVTGTNTWAIPVTNLPPDEYLIVATATNSSGFSSVISEKFFVLDFKGAAGTYSGLFITTNAPVATTNSGSLDVTLAPSGVFSGLMHFPGYTPVFIDTKFNANGVFNFGLNFPGNPVYVALQVNLTNGPESINGFVYSQTAGGFIAPLICYRAATHLTSTTAPAPGRYSLDLGVGIYTNITVTNISSTNASITNITMTNIATTNISVTNGYASVTASAGGALAVAGALPDGAAFSEIARVSTNGIWPVYAIPQGYGTNGALLGWVTNQTTGDVGGQLYWLKKSGIGKYYTAGISADLIVVGTNYTAIAAGNYSVVFAGGSLTAPVTNSFSIARAGGAAKVVSATDKLLITVSPAGVVSGSFLNPAGNNRFTFKGGFFGQTLGGSGFVLESNGQTGTFKIITE